MPLVIASLGSVLLPVLQYLFNIPIDVLSLWAVTSNDKVQVDAIMSDEALKEIARGTLQFHIWSPIVGIPLLIYSAFALLTAGTYSMANIYWVQLFAYIMIEGVGYFKSQAMVDFMD